MVYSPPKLIEIKEAQFENILNVLVISSELNLDKETKPEDIDKFYEEFKNMIYINIYWCKLF